jgi:hypothetical protein
LPKSLNETGIGVWLRKGWKETLEGNATAMSFKKYLKAIVRKLAYTKCLQEIAGGKRYGLEPYLLRVPTEGFIAGFMWGDSQCAVGTQGGGGKRCKEMLEPTCAHRLKRTKPKDNTLQNARTVVVRGLCERSRSSETLRDSGVQRIVRRTFCHHLYTSRKFGNWRHQQTNRRHTRPQVIGL